jgi:hypothetical protein
MTLFPQLPLTIDKFSLMCKVGPGLIIHLHLSSLHPVAGSFI